MHLREIGWEVVDGFIWLRVGPCEHGDNH